MEPQRYLDCLADDQRRLRTVAARDLTAAVPTCPGWTVADLVTHVADVYLHKVGCMRANAEPAWPPRHDPMPPLELLDHAYAELTAEFAQRSPESPSYTWYGPDQTVGFWYRRMAQEAVIHRVDAESAAGEPVERIPDDLAIDGVDEVLERFLSYGTINWSDECGPDLTEADGATVLVAAGDHGWLLTLEPSGVRVRPAGVDTGATARISGDPQTVLLWLWRRADPDAVARSGDDKAIDRLWRLLKIATQ